MDRSQTRRSYNAISPFYDALTRWNEAPILTAARDLLKPLAGEHILEVGFGTGHSLVAFTAAVGPNGRTYGTDLSEGMLARATATLARGAGLDRCELRLGDACDLAYADRSMNAVFMSFVLELFDRSDIPRVLAECHRVLIPGGRLVVAGMSNVGPRDTRLRLFEWAHRHFPACLDCCPLHVRGAMEEAGFTVVGSLTMRRVIPVEIVRGMKASPGMTTCCGPGLRRNASTSCGLSRSATCAVTALF